MEPQTGRETEMSIVASRLENAAQSLREVTEKVMTRLAPFAQPPTPQAEKENRSEMNSTFAERLQKVVDIVDGEVHELHDLLDRLEL